MAKLQGLENTYYDVILIETLNLEIYNFLKNLCQNTKFAKFEFFILKNTKVTRSSIFPIMTSL